MTITKVQIAAIYANCGKCGADLPEPMTGSLMLARATAGSDPVLKCSVCSADNKLPKWVVKQW